MEINNTSGTQDRIFTGPRRNDAETSSLTETTLPTEINTSSISRIFGSLKAAIKPVAAAIALNFSAPALSTSSAIVAGGVLASLPAITDTAKADIIAFSDASLYDNNTSLASHVSGISDTFTTQAQTLNLSQSPDGYILLVAQVPRVNSVGEFFTDGWVNTLALQPSNETLTRSNFDLEIVLGAPLMSDGNNLTPRGYETLPDNNVSFAGTPDFYDSVGRAGYINYFLISDSQQVSDINDFLALNPSFYPVYFNDQNNDFGISNVGTFPNIGENAITSVNGFEVALNDRSIGVYLAPYVIPEPGTIALMGIGLTALLLNRKRINF